MSNSYFAANAREKLSQAAVYWNKPMPGRYVSFKEIMNFALGKYGWIWATLMVSQITLGVTNIVLVQCPYIGIEPMHIQTMNNIVIFIDFFFTISRSRIIDNPKEPNKRFKRFMKYHGFPAIALSFVIVWFPYGSLPDGGVMLNGHITTGYFLKMAIVLLCILGIKWFLPLYNLAYDNMIMVISPNSQERMDVQVIAQFVFSMSWTISRPILTYMASTMFGETKDTNIDYWRYAFIPFIVIGAAMYYFMYFGVEERVVLAKTHNTRVGFAESIRALSKNRSFWVICIAQWAQFLEDNSRDLIDWTWRYQNFGYPDTPQGNQKSAGVKILIDTLFGLSASVPMVTSPFLTRFMSKKNLNIVSNVLNIFLLGVVYKTYHSVPALVTFRTLNQMFNELQGTIKSAIDADVRDMQQYISGERVDGMFGIVSYMGAFISMGTGYVTPWLQRRAGVYEGNGAVDPVSGKHAPWWILKNKESYDRMAKTMILSSVVGATMNVIPLFFYDLTEKKQRAVVRCLKIRAAFEDYGNGVYDPKNIVEAVEIIKDAEAKKLEGDVKTKKKKSILEFLKGDDGYDVDFVVNELHKFEQPEIIRQVKRAEIIASDGYESIFNFDEAQLKKARKLPKNTKAEKIVRKEEITFGKDMLKAHREMIKFYPDGKITEPDYQELDRLYSASASSKDEAKEIRKKIKQLEAEKSMFFHSTYPYSNAMKLLKERDNYTHLDDIFGLYEKAKTDVERLEEEAKIKAEEDAMLKKRDKEKRLAEKEMKKRK
ncbi:MAG: MFS transporter [Clostridia bacterium]|nr:MFS transporter [Clostridia bacterium]